jgi:hypothetical protein
MTKKGFFTWFLGEGDTHVFVLIGWGGEKGRKAV